METGETVGLVGKIEGRKIGGRQKAKPQHAADIGPHQPFTGVEQDRKIRRLSPG
mgnify:CR=1 FL=1